MSFETGVPSDNVVPGTFNVFRFLRAGSLLRSMPFTVAFIATKSSAGTGVVGTVYTVDDAATSDALAGANSEGAMMARQAILCSTLLSGAPSVKMTLINAPGASVANVQTITCVGTATSDGNQVVKVAGRTFNVGVRNGDSQNTNAAAIAATLQSRAEELPVIVSVATNVVTLTHPHTGVNGKDVIVSVDQQVAGMVATVATTVVGTGAADITPGLAALSPLRYDAICIANHASADITAFLLDLAVRWSAESKTWGWYFMFERGTIGAATALAAAANHHSVIVGNMNGNLNSAGEAAVTMGMLVFSRERPNAGYDGAEVPLYPPGAASLYTNAQKNTAIKAGLTVFAGKISSANALITDRVKVVQLVTTKTTIGAAPDDRNRDIAVSRTGVYLAYQLDTNAELAMGAETNPDGINQADAIPLIKDLASAILRAAARADPPIINRDFVEDDVQAIRVEPDGVTLGRNNARIPYHVNTPQHQIVWQHDIIVGIGA